MTELERNELKQRMSSMSAEEMQVALSVMPNTLLIQELDTRLTRNATVLRTINGLMSLVENINQ